jgi:hypothetical protein
MIFTMMFMGFMIAPDAIPRGWTFAYYLFPGGLGWRLVGWLVGWLVGYFG